MHAFAPEDKSVVRVQKLRLRSAESLICAALALGLFVTSLDANAFGGSARYVSLGLAAATCIAGASVVGGLTQQDGGPKQRDSTALFCWTICYFVWTGVQNLFLQSNETGAVASLIAVLIVCGTLKVDLPHLNAWLRRWLLIALVAFLVPAMQGQGFVTGERQWLSFLPGRYFGFSNPNALAFLAGLAILLAVPVFHRGHGRFLALIGLILLILTAGNTTAIALGLALSAYVGLGRISRAGPLKFSVATMACATPALLLWIPSDGGLKFLAWFQDRFDLSGRSFLWISLVRLTRHSGHLWFGIGEQGVSSFTLGVLDVYSAHLTILQVYLADGFVTALLFVLVAALATVRTLDIWAVERTKDSRLSFAMIVYWFVVSLSSTQPGTALALSLVVALAISRSGAASPPSADQACKPGPGLAAGNAHR